MSDLHARTSTATPADPQSRPPAEVTAQAGQTLGAPQVLARAHHGSVSKEQRAQIEGRQLVGTFDFGKLEAPLVVKVASNSRQGSSACNARRERQAGIGDVQAEKGVRRRTG